MKNRIDEMIEENEKRELLERVRRIETRLVKLMEFLNCDTNGKAMTTVPQRAACKDSY